jgi:hypothetical protein
MNPFAPTYCLPCDTSATPPHILATLYTALLQCYVPTFCTSLHRAPISRRCENFQLVASKTTAPNRIVPILVKNKPIKRMTGYATCGVRMDRKVSQKGATMLFIETKFIFPSIVTSRTLRPFTDALNHFMLRYKAVSSLWCAKNGYYQLRIRATSSCPSRTRPAGMSWLSFLLPCRGP